MSLFSFLLLCVFFAQQSKAQFLSNYCDASFSYTLDTNNCTISATADYFYPDLDYSWYLNGQSFSGGNFSIPVQMNGNYQLSLSVSNMNFCHASSTESVDVTCAAVNCAADASFTAVVDSPTCQATFTLNNPQAGYIYYWYFPDGSYIADSTFQPITVDLQNIYYGYAAVQAISNTNQNCNDYQYQNLTIPCLPSINGSTPIVVATNDSINCTTTLTIQNPVQGVYYTWHVSNSNVGSYTGSSITVATLLGNSPTNYSLFAQDLGGTYYEYLYGSFTPTCGSVANCNLNATLSHTFDSVNCLYDFSLANLPANAYTYWSFNGQFTNHQSYGQQVSATPYRAGDSLWVSVSISQETVNNGHYVCYQNISLPLGTATCGLYGPCNLDSLGYSYTYDSTTCTYTFSVNNPDTTGNTQYSWALAGQHLSGATVQVSFLYANQQTHNSLSASQGVNCYNYIGFDFTPLCGTQAPCNNNYTFSSNTTLDSCLATISVSGNIPANAQYGFYFSTLGYLNITNQTTVTVPLTYSGVYPIVFYVNDGFCYFDTTVYLLDKCTAIPMACYAEPMMTMDATNANTVWFGVEQFNHGSTYTFDFGDGQTATLDAHNYYYGIPHTYSNGNQMYNVVLTVETDTCSQTYGRQLRMGNVLAVDENNTTVENSLNLYPNPSTDILNIQLSQTVNESLQLQVVDVNGKICVQQTFNGQYTQIATASLPAGVYILQLSGRDNNSFSTITQRFVVIK